MNGMVLVSLMNYIHFLDRLKDLKLSILLTTSSFDDLCGFSNYCQLSLFRYTEDGEDLDEDYNWTLDFYPTGTPDLYNVMINGGVQKDITLDELIDLLRKEET